MPLGEFERYQDKRFKSPSETGFNSKYDFQGPELQDLIQRNPEIVFTQTLTLSTAQTPGAPLVITQPGRAIVFQCFNTANLFSPTTNTGTEDPNPSGFVHCRIQKNAPASALNLKHGRGYKGSFSQFYLSWPAQPGLSGRIIVLKYDDQPWLFDSSIAPSAQILNMGQLTVAAAGTSQQITTTVTIISSVVIKALAGNASSKIYVWNATGDGRVNGFELNKQESVTLAIDDLSKVWIDTDTNGSKISYVAT